LDFAHFLDGKNLSKTEVRLSSKENAMDWLRSKLSFLQYISLYIVAGLVLSFICLGIFAELAEEMQEQGWVVSFDTLIANSFHRNATPLATSFFLLLTRFGLELLWVFIILVGIYFINKRQWPYLLMLVITFAGGQLLNTSLKLFFSRPRPSFDDPIITALHYSFPSGHAMLSFITYGLLAYFLIIKTPGRPRRLLIIISAGVLVALIGLSRIYLGVHYLSDVIAGYAAGGFWLSICITAIYYIRRRYHQKNKDLDPETPTLEGEKSLN
jgi:membrane-associated phospholipid phosphatase